MAIINWNSTLEMGITEVDQQHKKLVDLTNELADKMKTGQGNDVLNKILDELVSYTDYHFASEEKLMAKHSFNLMTEHLAEHNDFKKKVIEVQQNIKTSKMSYSPQVLNFLSKWLRDHIKISDKKFSEFYHSKAKNLQGEAI